MFVPSRKDVTWKYPLLLKFHQFVYICVYFLIGGTRIGIVFDVIDNILYFSHEKWEIYRW